MDYRDYLEHYGVMGMRWGKRSGSSSTGTRLERKRDKISKAINNDIKSFEPYRKTGVKSKSNKLLLHPSEIDDIVKGLETTRDKSIAKLNKRIKNKEIKINNRKEALAANYKTTTTKGEKVADHVLKGVGANIAVNVAGNAAYALGMKNTAAAIVVVGGVYTLGQYGAAIKTAVNE